jgi:CheY-like chemotaxis protein/HPt (histidine-containing phosphotransfer) domain-containing protein
MGGEIGVRSTLGRGSTFWFEVALPAVARSAHLSPGRTLVPAPLSTPAAVQSVRVLVVEDNPINQEVVKGYLQHAGYRVNVAANGREAVDMVRSFPFHVVLMDMQMPEMDGLEATRAIRALPGPHAQVPVVMLTANAMAQDRERSLLAGADDHLPKPIDRARLLEMVERLSTTAAAGVSSGAPPPSASDATHEVDFSQIEQLLGAVGPEKLKSLLVKAHLNFERQLLAISEAAERGDLDELSRVAHALRGSSGSIGLAAASKLAGVLEERAREGGADFTALAARLCEAIGRGLTRVDVELALVTTPGSAPPSASRPRAVAVIEARVAHAEPLIPPHA